jgi:hypothetical protein
MYMIGCAVLSQGCLSGSLPCLGCAEWGWADLPVFLVDCPLAALGWSSAPATHGIRFFPGGGWHRFYCHPVNRPGFLIFQDWNK